MIKLTFLFMILGVTMSDAVSAELYKIETPNGNVHYYDEKTLLVETGECRASNKFKLFTVQEYLISLFNELGGIKRRQSKEREIEKESGIQDMQYEYQLGALIVNTKDKIKDSWIVYKKLGGKASAPEKVRHDLKNPCSGFEESE